MDLRAITKETYNKHASTLTKKFEGVFEDFVKKQVDLFLKNLKGKLILDLGCGSGKHAEYFTSKGYSVLCADNAKAMLKICKAKGLETMLVDIEDFGIPGKFDGIWAYCSLLHIPKERMRKAVWDINYRLRKDGLLGVALKEGEGEKLEVSESNPEIKRFFAYYTDEEIRNLFIDFDIIHHSRTEIGKSIFLNYLMRK